MQCQIVVEATMAADSHPSKY